MSQQISKKNDQNSLNVAIDLKLGDLISIVLSKKGEVYTMGQNIHCQLGISKQVEF